MDLDPLEVAQAIARRLLALAPDSELENRLVYVDAQLNQPKWAKTKLQRVPYFCSGCPHSSSIPRPMDSREMVASAATGWRCGTRSSTSNPRPRWAGKGELVGQSHFTETNHVFQNLGDGTYYHSGYLAIRWAISTGTNITYKILYNDASAMTAASRRGPPQRGDDHQPAPWRGHPPHRRGVG